MQDLNVLEPLIGGALIGIAASGMLWTNGRIMGISGILGGILRKQTDSKSWRVAFLIGLVAGSSLIPLIGFSSMSLDFTRGLTSAIIGGLLVGFGTSIGNGCTSGHGVCGISRFSKRSIVATLTFMVFGILTVFIFNIYNLG